MGFDPYRGEADRLLRGVLLGGCAMAGVLAYGALRPSVGPVWASLAGVAVTLLLLTACEAIARLRRRRSR